jgi:CysZ protein
MISPALRAIGQLDDPALLGAILLSVAASAVAFVALGGLAAWAFQAWVMADGLWLGSLLGLVLAVAAGLMLFVPVTVVIASLFADQVAAAVEHEHYPGLPAAQPASLAAQVWDGLALGLRVLLMQLLALALSLLIPGFGLLAGFAIAAWAMGRGLFLAVAMRRMTRAQATIAYRRRRWRVLGQGALVAAAAMVPIVNLIAPVLGIGVLVHVLHEPPG